MNNSAPKFLPISADERRIELRLENEAAVIRLSSWVEGLGWCGEKTMTVDAKMLDELHRLIAAARFRLSRNEAEDRGGSAVNHVIEFPLAPAS